MMKSVAFLVTAAIGTAALATEANTAPPSGIVGIYAIVQRVEVEPNSDGERIRIWGAFAFVNGGSTNPLEVTAAKRGQLYFRPPSVSGRTATSVEALRKEFADIKSVAGTGQAIAFGGWRYGGQFSASVPAPGGFGVAEPGTGVPIDAWMRADSVRSGEPITYVTNVGVVKLSETGGHATVIARLRAALK